MDCKPGSVPETEVAGEDHSSRPAVTDGLERSDPDTDGRRFRSRPARAGHPPPRPYLSLLQEGFTPPPVTWLSRVGSYPTISPLPPRPEGRGLAVSFLLHFP